MKKQFLTKGYDVSNPKPYSVQHVEAQRTGFGWFVTQYGNTHRFHNTEERDAYISKCGIEVAEFQRPKTLS